MSKLPKFLTTLLASTVLSTTYANAQPVNEYGKDSNIKVEQLARYHSNTEYGESGTEIVSFDSKYQQVYSINGALNAIDILDMRSLNNGDFPLKKRIFLKDLGIAGSDITSVAVNKKYHYIAVSIPANNKTDAGTVAFLNHDGKLLSHVSVGSLPDMLTFSHDSKKLLVANEGEPNDDLTVNPEGSISSIIATKDGVIKQQNVKTIPFNRKAIGNDIRPLGRNNEESFLNIEPEYITIDDENKFAYITIQERNAIAKFDIKRDSIVKVQSLGYKDFRKTPIDVSDKDNAINMKNYPLFGMYQPDGIAQMKVKGKTYLLTANEGDTQDYDGYSEETRIADFQDQFNFNGKYLTETDNLLFSDKKALGRLKTTTSNPFLNTNGKFDVPVTFGGRSFSILNSDLTMIYDSQADFETVTAEANKQAFNSEQESPGEVKFDSRSDDKGPEPESVVTGEIGKSTYAFIGLERTGGIMVYNVTNPQNPVFETYFNSIDNGDISPEGLTFIPASESPTKTSLLLASHEMSGTIAVYELSSL
ncbi:choice-of-anchor I family protein [Macrococcoides canis]|uniref:choice-of-anchor I family protein n=1 Tax=Macrococcoides canis TaxID=1855823 RepID=UPI00207D3F78|nr:choice-of-anchor I family protein [Macrococcus canis]MCO4095396.1 choice-of-anchor I family protein [Macrococcus canis]UTH08122.1 choice-of-anchor I family protein [Macrococcus canis]